jgi:hypothetical protein
MLLTPKRKPARPKPVKVRALLIDPFKCAVFPLVVNWADQADIHHLLDCDLIQSVYMATPDLLWIDESGLLREPFIYPQFIIKGVNGAHPLTGYGLVTGFYGREPDMVTDCVVRFESLPIIWEEHWPRRINPDQCIDQLLRVYFDR